MSLSSEVQKLISSEQQREVMPVATESKRITFTVTPDMGPLMDRAKRMFYAVSYTHLDVYKRQGY